VPVLDWLLDSDPAIRWQVLRDLVHSPAEVVVADPNRWPRFEPTCPTISTAS
jgi:hypothetical protein